MTTITRYNAVELPLLPQQSGYIALSGVVPTPSSPLTNTDVTQPGVQQGAWLQDGQGTRVLPYTRTADARTISGQIGPFATLMQQGDNRPLVSIALPPDVSQFMIANPLIENVLTVLDALLTRIDSWTKAGSLACGSLAKALWKLIGGYQHSVTLSVDLMLFLGRLKQIAQEAMLLFLARATEATGTAAPLINQAAQNAITFLLTSDPINTPLPSGTALSTLNAQCAAIAAGVLVPSA